METRATAGDYSLGRETDLFGGRDDPAGAWQPVGTISIPLSAVRSRTRVASRRRCGDGLLISLDLGQKILCERKRLFGGGFCYECEIGCALRGIMNISLAMVEGLRFSEVTIASMCSCVRMPSHVTERKIQGILAQIATSALSPISGALLSHPGRLAKASVLRATRRVRSSFHRSGSR